MHALTHTIRLLDGDLGRERFGLAGFPVVMARVFWVWGLAELFINLKTVKALGLTFTQSLLLRVQ
jgi:hypothetical protein